MVYISMVCLFIVYLFIIKSDSLDPNSTYNSKIFYIFIYSKSLFHFLIAR